MTRSSAAGEEGRRTEAGHLPAPSDRSVNAEASAGDPAEPAKRVRSALGAEHFCMLLSVAAIVGVFVIGGVLILYLGLDGYDGSRIPFTLDRVLVILHVLSLALGLISLERWVSLRHPGDVVLFGRAAGLYLLAIAAGIVLEAFVLKACFLIGATGFRLNTLDLANALRLSIGLEVVESAGPCGYAMRQMIFLMPAALLRAAAYSGEGAAYLQARRSAFPLLFSQSLLTLCVLASRFLSGVVLASHILVGLACGLLLFWLAFGLLMFWKLEPRRTRILDLAAAQIIIMGLIALLCGHVADFLLLGAMCGGVLAWAARDVAARQRQN